MDKIAHLKQQIDKEEDTYQSLKIQADKLQDQMNDCEDKIKWYKEQLSSRHLS